MASARGSYDYYYYRPYTPPRGIRFGRTELGHIGIAVTVLTLAFTLSLSGFISNYPFYMHYPEVLLLFLLAAFAAVGTGFLLHEIAHKAVAQRYGCWAEFRSDRMGLMLSIITSLLGFVYAAPGAVYIAGNIDDEQNGKISIAGPLTNVVIALAFLGIFFALAPRVWIVGLVSMIGAQVNSFLAAFNMIPLMPLDGAKVAHWNIGIYIAAFIPMIILAIYTLFFIGLP